jgi:hypothetical protein
MTMAAAGGSVDNDGNAAEQLVPLRVVDQDLVV